jgi:hypothetical protein
MKLVAASVVVALTAINCVAVSERILLDRFFVASRLRDRTALAGFATVVFEPLADGIVREFVLLEATRERPLDGDPADGGPISEHRRIGDLSLADPINPVDPRQQRIVLLEKRVTVSARVGLPDGTEVTRTIVLTLQRARVAGDQPRAGRWIVVSFGY